MSLTVRRSCRVVFVLNPRAFQRRASSHAAQRSQTVAVPVGGSGDVLLDIHEAADQSAHNDTLIHLASGPYSVTSSKWKTDKTFTELLANALPAVNVIDVSYRLSPRHKDPSLDHRYPRPVHDVFTAWDYIQEEYLADKNDSTGQRTCVYSSHMGSGLALSLALTNPTQVHGVVLENPLVDWVVLEELIEQASDGVVKSPVKHKQAQELAEAARELVKLRTSLFRTPSGYFDSFASPVHFLRAPGRDTPLTKSAAPVDIGEELKQLHAVEETSTSEAPTTSTRTHDYGPYDDDMHIHNGESQHDTALLAQSSDVSELPQLIQPLTDLSLWQPRPSPPTTSRRRKVIRRWPMNEPDREAILPFMDIVLNPPPAGRSVLQRVFPVIQYQVQDLIDLLARACCWGRDKSFIADRISLTQLSSTAAVFARRQQVVELIRKQFDRGSSQNI